MDGLRKLAGDRDRPGIGTPGRNSVVLPRRAHGNGILFEEGPERDIVPLFGKEDGESGSPAARTEDGDAHSGTGEVRRRARAFSLLLEELSELILFSVPSISRVMLVRWV